MKAPTKAALAAISNREMARQLAKGEARDVAQIGELQADGSYLLPASEIGDITGGVVDYCAAPRELWIGSIGQRVSDGALFAATDFRFYESKPEGFRCVWLR